MNQLIYKHKTPNQQRGGALLVAIIIIFMLSIMGVSAMRDSTLEKRMATNSIQSATAFHSAESNTDMVLNNTDGIENLMANANYADVRNGILADSDKVTTNIDMLQNIGLTTEAQLQFVGEGSAVGYSTNMSTFRIEVVGNASVDAVRAQSEVKQGVYRVGPKRLTN